MSFFNSTRLNHDVVTNMSYVYKTPLLTLW